MSPDQAIKLIEAIASLIGALGWPLVFLSVVIYFRKPLKGFVGELGEFRFKVGATGVEAAASRQQIETAALLGAAAAKSGALAVKGSGGEETQAREIADVVSRSVQPAVISKLAGASVLWVDDNPDNNRYERRALEALGIRFTLSTSTEDAVSKLQSNGYDAIISDMGRPPDNRAGYTLLAKIQELGYATPFVIYAGSNLPEHKAEARRRGAFGNTNNPQELFQLVLSAIQEGRRA